MHLTTERISIYLSTNLLSLEVKLPLVKVSVPKAFKVVSLVNLLLKLEEQVTAKTCGIEADIAVAALVFEPDGIATIPWGVTAKKSCFNP